MSGTPVPLWIEAVTAALLVASGIASLVAAFGIARLESTFQRMHPPALVSTFGAWTVAAASIVQFSAFEGTPVLHAWVIPIVLAITMPVTTVMLARAVLFRKRQSGADVPPPLGSS